MQLHHIKLKRKSVEIKTRNQFCISVTREKVSRKHRNASKVPSPPHVNKSHTRGYGILEKGGKTGKRNGH